MPIPFYATPSSPFSARVRLVAAITGAKLDERAIPGGVGSDERRALTHFGKIPALEVDGRVLIESWPLMEYLVDISGGCSLMPGSAVDRARVRGIIAAHDITVLGAAWPMLLQLRSGKPDLEIVKPALIAATGQYDVLAKLFDGDAGPALVGQLTLADLAIAPFGVLFGKLFPMFGQASPFDANPRLSSWWTAVQEIEPVERVLTAMDDAFTRAFLKK